MTPKFLGCWRYFSRKISFSCSVQMLFNWRSLYSADRSSTRLLRFR